MSRRVLLSWSSGKDSAWTMHVLQQQADVEIVGLLTTFNEVADRVAMHAVRRELVESQAKATGLPLWPVPLPSPCTNEEYEERMRAALQRAEDEHVTHVAFGDLFLEDIRDYRIQQMAGTGIEPLFPIWCSPEETPDLARGMIEAGFNAVVTCVDPSQLPKRFIGKEFDHGMLANLPESVDPCGENGEFHTFCHAGPIYTATIGIRHGETTVRDGFVFHDLLADY